MLLRDGEAKQALSLIDQLIALDPENDSYARRRAFALIRAGRTDEGLGAVRALREKAELPADFNGLCWTLATANVALEAALKDCQSALRLDPEFSPAMDSTGLVYLRLGRFKDAVESYGKAIAKRSGSSAYMGRALALSRLGDSARANEDRAEALRLDDESEYRFEGYGLKLD